MKIDKSLFRVKIVDPAGKKETASVESPVLIVGRNLPSQAGLLSLADGQVSSRHAKVSLEEDGLWIEDLASSNGTWIEGKKIEAKTRLTPGTAVRLGQTILFFETSRAAGKRVAAPKEKPAAVIEAGESLQDLYLGEATIESARERLRVVFEMSAAMSAIDSTESLAPLLLDHLDRALSRPGRRIRGGVLLGSDLILKAYRPEDKPPSCSLTLARRALSQKSAFLWQSRGPGCAAASESLIQSGTKSAIYAPLIWNGESLGVVSLDAQCAQPEFTKDDLRLVQIMAMQATMFLKTRELQSVLQRANSLKTRLLAQFPKSIAEKLAGKGYLSAIPSERVEHVTALISDVRGFTLLAASMEPEDVVRMLNEMFHDLTPIVLKYNGAVDKYSGDALLAVFGSPEPDPDQWEHAVRAALDMQAAMRDLESNRWRGRAPFRIGIGLHTGPAIHGFIGAPERTEYTVIGDTINVTSRYCAGAKPGEILISPSMFSRIHHCLNVDYPPRDIETKHEGLLKAYVVRGWKTGEKNRSS